MILYVDPSALVKRYVAEEGSDDVAVWLAQAATVACSRIGFVETYRALMLAGLVDPQAAVAAFATDWDRIAVIEVSDTLTRRAATLAAGLGLRSLDAIHLASAEVLVSPDLTLATWDRRLWQAAQTLGLQPLPSTLPGL